MPYNFAAESFHTKKLCSRLSYDLRFFTEIGRLAFLRTPFGGLRGNVRYDHLRLIGKRVVDFLLALIKLFSLGVTAEALRAIIGSKSVILLQRGPVDRKFQVEGVAPHQPFFFSVNQAKLSFVWYKNLYKSFFRFVTIYASNGQTDGRTDRILIAFRVCIICSAVIK